MRINTKLDKLELTRTEEAVLEKADDLTRLLAKHGCEQIRDEANRAGFHIERLRRILGLAVGAMTPRPVPEMKSA